MNERPIRFATPAAVAIASDHVFAAHGDVLKRLTKEDGRIWTGADEQRFAMEVVPGVYLSSGYVLEQKSIVPSTVFSGGWPGFPFGCPAIPETLPLPAPFVWLKGGIIQGPHGPFDTVTFHEAVPYDGFVWAESDGLRYRVATTEKALVDYWTWSTGDWSQDRHREIRYSNLKEIDPEKVIQWATASPFPRVHEAARVFLSLQRWYIARGSDSILDRWHSRGFEEPPNFEKAVL